MVNEYIGLITHLIAFKRKHPEYAEKIYKALKVMEVDKILINAIEEDLNTLEENDKKTKEAGCLQGLLQEVRNEVN